jgi:hypothetical protein
MRNDEVVFECRGKTTKGKNMRKYQVNLHHRGGFIVESFIEAGSKAEARKIFLATTTYPAAVIAKIVVF